jgi:transposase
MTTTATRSTASTEPDTDVPVLVGIKEIVQLVNRQEHTVYRWRLPRNGHPPKLPLPLAILSRTPLWRLDTILALAEQEGYQIDQKALTALRKGQGR